MSTALLYNSSISLFNTNSLIISDYRRGLFDKNFLTKIIELKERSWAALNWKIIPNDIKIEFLYCI